MYDEKEIKEAIKEIASRLFETIIDKVKSLKLICRLLMLNIYLKLSIVEWVRFYSDFWKAYIFSFYIVLGVISYFVSDDERKIRLRWIFANLFIVAIYILFKRKWAGKKKSTDNLTQAFKQESITKQWFLREENVRWRQFYFGCVFFWISVYAGMAIFFQDIYACQDLRSVTEYIYPMIFMIPCFEMWLRYAWLTKDEYYDTKFQIAPLDENVKTLLMIQKELEEKMPDNSLIGYWANRGKRQSMSEEEFENIIQKYFHEGNLLREFYKKKQNILNGGSGLLESALELLAGHSVLFKTFFYKDMDYAFLFTAYLKLIRGQRILLVCSKNVDLEEMLRWMKAEIREMNGTDWWDFGTYEPFCCPGNVVAVYCTDFLAFMNDDLYIDFRDKVGFLLLQEPLEYPDSCLEQIKLFLTSKRETNDISMAVTSGSIDALELISKEAEDDKIYAGQLWASIQNVQVMYWKEEMSDIGGNQGQSWGMEARLLQYIIEEVHPQNISWIGGGKIPVWNILWAYKGIYGIDISEKVIPEEYGYGLQLDEEIHIIAEDFRGNYRKTAELLSSRGTDKTIIHVIVPGYLLRDYIALCPDNMLLRNGIKKKEIPSERNIVYEIFSSLLKGWVSNEWIKGKLTMVFHRKGETEQIIRKALRKYVLEGKALELEKKTAKEIYYHIHTDKQIERLKKRDEVIRFFSEEEDKILNIATDLTYNSIFQKCLPGQNLVLQNRSYQFVGIIEKEGKYLAKIKANSSLANEKIYYRQMREYKLEREGIVNSPVIYNSDMPEMKWLYGEADITVKTEAYFAMRTFRDVNHAARYRCKDIPLRKYKRKRFIKVFLEKKLSGEARLIGTWLKEAFYSLCPDDIDYIAVCMRNCRDSISIDNVESNVREKPESQVIYIMEDRDRDSGILQDIFEKQEEIMSTMKEYMNIVDKREIQIFWQKIKPNML